MRHGYIPKTSKTPEHRDIGHMVRREIMGDLVHPAFEFWRSMY